MQGVYTGGVNLFKTASIVSLFTLASRITGLARELLVAAFFGASAATDAFNVAFRIPNLLRRLFAEGAFSQAFVPVLAATREREGDEATQLLINRIATVLAWALLVTSLLGVLAAPVLVWLMASGFEGRDGTFDQTVMLTRVMFPYIAFMSLVALSAGILNTWKRFVVPAATPVLLNVSMIAAAALGAPFFKNMGWDPIMALAVGVMVGGALQLGIQIPALRRLGLLPKVSWRMGQWRAAWAHEGVKRILALMAPALLGVGVAQLSLLINTQIASHLQTGSVSWLSYADRLMEFPTALLGVALGVVLLPQLSAAQAQGNAERFSDLIDWGLRWVVLLAIPSAVGLLIFAEPLVAVLYHYGAFQARDVVQTAWALRGYGVGLLGLIAIKVLAPGFYARQDIRTPVRIAVVVLVFTQLMNWVWVPWIGHAGLALSIGLGAMLNAGWLAWGLRRQGSYRPSAGWGKFFLKVLVASLVLAAWLAWGNQAVGWTDAAHLSKGLRVWVLAGMMAGAAVLYFGTLWALRMPLREFMRRAG